MLKKNSSKSDFFGAVALLVGTCIGAGIFGLPYVISKVGVVIGIVYILVLGLITLIVCLAYGEVVLRTEGAHQFSNYVGIYLGEWGRKIALVSIIIGFYGALTAYITEISFFLYQLLSPIIGGKILYYQIAYFCFGLITLSVGLGMIRRLEKVLMFFVLFIVVFIVIYGLPMVQIENITYIHLSNILLPYGVILFAIACSSAIPDMKNVLINEKKKLKKAIILGLLIPIAVYISFVLIIVGISGHNTSESAIQGLLGYFGPIAVTIGYIMGCLTMTTSFMSLGLTLKETFQFDLKIKPLFAVLLVVVPPLTIVIGKFFTFIEILGITGAVISGIDGILVISMYQKARTMGKRQPEYQIQLPFYFEYIIYIIFLLGMLYEVYMVVNKFR